MKGEKSTPVNNGPIGDQGQGLPEGLQWDALMDYIAGASTEELDKNFSAIMEAVVNRYGDNGKQEGRGESNV